jgi:hypothetical protein
MDTLTVIGGNRITTSAIQSRSRLMRFLGFSNPEKGGNSEVKTSCSIKLLKIAPNGLQHVFEKWVERCKKCIACQERNLEKEAVTAPPQISDSE